MNETPKTENPPTPKPTDNKQPPSTPDSNIPREKISPTLKPLEESDQRFTPKPKPLDFVGEHIERTRGNTVSPRVLRDSENVVIRANAKKQAAQKQQDQEQKQGKKDKISALKKLIGRIKSL